MKNLSKVEKELIQQKREEKAKIVGDKNSNDEQFLGALKDLCTLNIMDN